MAYIHLYTEENDFNEDYWGSNYLEPWVSLTVEGSKRVDYNKNFKGYVRFDILSNGQIKWKSSDTAITRTIEYNKNGESWIAITSSTAGANISVVSGDIVYFRGENESYAEVINPDYVSDGIPDPYNNSNIRTVSFNGTTCNFNLSGNIMSLIKKDRVAFRSLKNLSGECNFYGMFRIGGDKLKSIENLSLPATGLTNGCYGYMFTSAGTQTVMSLPAKGMKEACYRNMFSDCKNLTTVPALSNTDLAAYCFNGMFARCTSLQSVPSNYLPVTNIELACYASMFKDCSAFTTAPELPATKLANSCYNNMFKGCTSLTEAPELPATTLARSCYDVMFKGCTSLTAAPVLPATTLARACYANMFSGCTSLTTAPELPATTLEYACYTNMFAGCTNLTGGIEELPATALVDFCYNQMFSGCTNLETAPKILATTGGNLFWVMEDMFNGCSKIDSLVCLITDYFGYAPTNRWLNGVSETGTFYKNPSVPESVIRDGQRGVPSTWTVEDYTG